MVLQHMVLDKMNQSLHEKEKGKKSDRTILFPGGKGRHLTDAEVIKLKREIEDEKTRQEAQKEARKTQQDQRWTEKEHVETEWKEILKEHALALEAWEETCRELRAKGTRVKDLPKKPKRAPKPKPVEIGPDSEDEEEGIQESDGDDARVTQRSHCAKEWFHMKSGIQHRAASRNVFLPLFYDKNHIDLCLIPYSVYLYSSITIFLIVSHPDCDAYSSVRRSGETLYSYLISLTPSHPPSTCVYSSSTSHGEGVFKGVGYVSFAIKENVESVFDTIQRAASRTLGGNFVFNEPRSTVSSLYD